MTAVTGTNCKTLYSLAGLTPEQVQGSLPAVRIALEKGKEAWGPYETYESIIAKLSNGSWQLWGLFFKEGGELYCLTTTFIYPTGVKVFSILYLMGEGWFDNPDIMQNALPTLERFGEAGGADMMRIDAKPAIARKMKAWGFKETDITIMKPLTEERIN